MKYIKIILLLFSFCSCDTFDGKLKIENKTNENLFVIATDRVDLKNYPNNLIEMEYYYSVPIDSIKTMGVYNTTWEHKINNSENKCLNIYAINKDTLIKFPQDSIIKYQKYYRVKSYTLDQLEKMNWKIIIK